MRLINILSVLTFCGCPKLAASAQALQECEQALPHHIIVNRPVSAASAEQFDLFAFLAKPFDPSKKTLLYVEGGPGAMPGLNLVKELASQFPDMNVVTFHPRGGGCSSFTESIEPSRVSVGTKLVAEDIEALKEQLGIKKWDLVVGMSYGTMVSRFYANKYPNSVGFLLLYGLVDPRSTTDTEFEIKRLSALFDERRRSPDSALTSLTETQYQQFLQRIRLVLQNFPISFGFYIEKEQSADPMWNWNQYAFDFSMAKGLSYDESKNRSFNRPYSDYADTFFALNLLSYAGATQAAERPIQILLKRLDIVPSSNEASLQPIWTSPSQSLGSKYQLGFFSMQLFSSTHERDLEDHVEQHLCTATPTLVVQGTYDLVTPPENVRSMLRNTDCQKGPAAAFFIPKMGHDFSFEPYVLSYLRAALGGKFENRPSQDGKFTFER